ncbi:MAG: hypothetical protein IPJ74_26665 [Saprospiraceae bacterium]|nr:hypothetical protein [Saprospiraceae bacterium]
MSVELDKTEEAIGYYEQAAQVFRELYEFTGLESYLQNYNYVQGELKKLR